MSLARLGLRSTSTLVTPILRASMSSSSSSQPIDLDLVTSTRSPSGRVALLHLNKPKALNALSTPLMQALGARLDEIAHEDKVGCVVLTGAGGKAFAAGADIKEMQNKTFEESYGENFLEPWTKISTFRKPIVGAVHGHCLGGGCELAMMTDILLASPYASFGQPEIKLGIIPGAGGTQRLIRAIGPSRAMEIILTGRSFTGQQASDWGLVSRVVPDAEGQGKGEGVVAEAMKVAEEIAGMGRISTVAAKEAVKIAAELPLTMGVQYERRLFHSLFATADQKEGMTAFVEKRPANFARL